MSQVFSFSGISESNLKIYICSWKNKSKLNVSVLLKIFFSEKNINKLELCNSNYIIGANNECSIIDKSQKIIMKLILFKTAKRTVIMIQNAVVLVNAHYPDQTGNETASF